MRWHYCDAGPLSRGQEDVADQGATLQEAVGVRGLGQGERAGGQRGRWATAVRKAVTAATIAGWAPFPLR